MTSKNFFLKEDKITIDIDCDYEGESHHISTEWKFPTWKDMSELLMDPSVISSHFNYGQQLLHRFLVSWDLKDNNGNDIPCTKKNKDALVSPIAMELISQFSQQIELTNGATGISSVSSVGSIEKLSKSANKMRVKF